MKIDKVKFLMDKYITNHEETGAAFVMTRNGREELSYSSGLADIANNIPMNTDTICRAFSCSKVATSVCCMLLIEQGLLDVDWKLERIIPEFASPSYIRGGKTYPSDSIKIRDLLNMTSGIPYPWNQLEGIDKTNQLWMRLDDSVKNKRGMTTVQFAQQTAECPLMFNAGEEWMYGGSADILGAVVEIISGQKFGKFMSKNVLKPLGMNDTGFFVSPEKKDRLSVLYENCGENPKPFDGVNLCIYDLFEEPDFESGGAGLFSTASDYSKLGAMLSNGGIYNGTRILGSKTIEFMRENGLSDTQKRTFNWDSCHGYGYANLTRMVCDKNQAGTLASKGSFGWDGWTGTYLIADPNEKISVTLFVQRCGGGTTQLARSLVNTVYSMIE